MPTHSARPVTREDRGDVAIMWIDHPPVNALSHGVRAEIVSLVSEIGADPAIRAAVLACRGRTFVAGADIREFGKPPLAPLTFDVAFVLEASHKPIVAAIHGTALGGGCELALGCHGRVANAGARLGLPEVTLGILPGGGGTVRLPRLIDPIVAIDIIGNGRHVSAPDALDLGLIDAIVDGDVVEGAIEAARALVGKPLRRLAALPTPSCDEARARAKIGEIEKKARGQTSPGVAARVAFENLTSHFVDGQAREREASYGLIYSEQAFALRHVFFAERDAAKIPLIDGLTPRKVDCVGVAGAGTMGAGIAVALADVGYSVIVVERDEAADEAGRARVTALFDRNVASGRIDEARKLERLASIAFAHDLEAFAPCDLVIEAVFDDLDVKQALFRDLSRIVRDDCILATNTSYLDPNAIASAAKNPSRVVGMHFFSPANVMRLMEAVRANVTSSEVLATAVAVGKKMKKLPIVAGACEGFIGNRILATYRKQCEYMLEEGATPRDVDDALESLGLPMGPFAAADLSGLDISWARRKRLAPTRDPRERYVAIPDQLCEGGRLGRKTGAGWYRYEGGKRFDDPEVIKLIENASKEKQIERRIVARDEIRARIVAAMANEGAKILDEGMALRAGDIDLVYINGYGWPRWLGGPMFQADRLGLAAVLAEVRRMEARDGFGWAPAPLLVKLVERGETFTQG
jgi:3-hydroxyacyl-CoA dehydrogenase